MSSNRRLARSGQVTRVSGPRMVVSPPRPEVVVGATPPAVYAEAVHRAVCEFSGSDGFRQCLLYATAGKALVMLEDPGLGHCSIQVGSILLQPDPADPSYRLAMTSSDAGLDRGEYHAWLAFESGIYVDFASRHYARYVNEMTNRDSERVPWNRPDPPAFLWSYVDDLPEWVSLRSDLTASIEFSRRINRDVTEVFEPLAKLAYRHFLGLKDGARPSRPPAVTGGATPAEVRR